MFIGYWLGARFIRDTVTSVVFSYFKVQLWKLTFLIVEIKHSQIRIFPTPPSSLKLTADCGFVYTVTESWSCGGSGAHCSPWFCFFASVNWSVYCLVLLLVSPLWWHPLGCPPSSWSEPGRCSACPVFIFGIHPCISNLGLLWVTGPALSAKGHLYPRVLYHICKVPFSYKVIYW